MRILAACEFSGVVREAFAARGHDAWSCDLLPTEIPGQHHQGDVLDLIGEPWDLVIAFPPCTYLARSGARWHSGSIEQDDAIEFARRLMKWPAPAVVVENPVGALSEAVRPPDQVIQPWQYGHGETKATCLWLSGLMPLQPTVRVPGRAPRVHREPPGPDRWKNRSRTLPGIAAAMAAQWCGPMPMTLF